MTEIVTSTMASDPAKVAELCGDITLSMTEATLSSALEAPSSMFCALRF